MKKLLSYVVPFMLGCIAVGCGLLLLSIVLGGCSPKFNIPEPVVNTPCPDDTITWIHVQRLNGTIQKVNIDSLVNSKVVIDTIILGGEYVELHDSVPCPPGLRDTVYTGFTAIKYVPGKAVPIRISVNDTIFKDKKPVVINTPPITITKDTGWPERLAWLAGIIILLAGYWRRFRNNQHDVA